MAQQDHSTEQAGVLRRLTAMGIDARLMKGQRCVLASLKLRDTPFDSEGGAQRVKRVVFASVGQDKIKCLRPRALFQLPMIKILDCRDARAIEDRIRITWQRHQAELKRTREWLGAIGAEPRYAEEASVLSLAIMGEGEKVRATLIDGGQVILPGCGPLSGVPLERREDRLLSIDRSTDSGVELEIAISTRLEELSRLAARLTDRRRLAAAKIVEPPPERSDAKQRSHRLLLVGPRLAEERACIESLRLRGYEVRTAHTETEALAVFDRTSPELLIADMNMGRAEGIELVLAMRRVAGVEEVPVVLVDSHKRPSRRAAARSVGAAGYLIHPIDVARIAKRLSTMVGEPRRRRYTRYQERVSVEIEGSSTPGLGLGVGRGGMFFATDVDLPTRSVHPLRLSVPTTGHTLRVDAEILYRRGSVGAGARGVGVRFHGFEEQDEQLLIDYLRSLEVPAG